MFLRRTPAPTEPVYGDVPHVPPEYHSTMTHPNRSRNSPSRSPTGREVAEARIALGLSYAECGALIHESPRRWAAFEQDDARMHPAAWELFQLKAPSNGGPVAVGQTWYDAETGVPIIVRHVAGGIVSAQSGRSVIEITVQNWPEFYVRRKPE